MKKLINKINFARNNKASAIAALLILFTIAFGCSAEKPAAPPTEAEAQTLVKNTTSDFANAIEKQDFKAFKESTSKEFQTQYTDDQMKTTFKSFTDQKELIVPILRDAAKMDAKFTAPPAIREEKGYSILVTNGSFETEPAALRFTNEYIYQDGKWKLIKINVQL